MAAYERKLALAQLFDFYGELLTDKQKSIMELYILEDISQSEIAQNLGVSRQAVYDHIHKSTKILEDYEKKLGLLNRFKVRSNLLTSLRDELGNLKAVEDIKPMLSRIDTIIDF